MPTRRAYAKKRPYKRSNRRYKKKNFRKNRPYTKKMAIPSGIPDRIMVKLKYQDQYFLSNTGTLSQVFRINSLNDPDFTGVGHQPRGYDNWAAVFERYKVSGCKVAVNIVNGSSSSVKVFMWADQGTFPSSLTYQDCAEMPYGRATLLVPNSAAASTYGFKRYYSIKKLAGVDYQDDIYSAAVGANPANIAYASIGAEGVSSSAFSVYINVQLTFYCQFYDRARLPVN